MFRYVKYMISQDRFYMGEAKLDHYKRCNSGFSHDNLSVPKNPTSLKLAFWYAVSCGRAVGIYLTWYVATCSWTRPRTPLRVLQVRGGAPCQRLPWERTQEVQVLLRSCCLHPNCVAQGNHRSCPMLTLPPHTSLHNYPVL